jgi:2-amino-4-hydroxy-6-hydroxymethyldihydropteridine diphosphokinase
MRAWIGIGSNLGDRTAACARAMAALDGLPGTRVVRVSSLYLTEPVGLGGCEWFVNAVAEVSTALDPGDLLEGLLSIERAEGRERAVQPTPRTLDLDLLDAGGQRSHGPRLTLPHPRMHLRRFQLEPLAEIAPEWKHPLLNRTARELLDALEDAARIVWIARLAGRGDGRMVR